MCRLVDEATRDYLIHVLREGKVREDVYETIRQANGFCQDHTRVLGRLSAKSLGDRRAIARLYGWLLEDLTPGVALGGPCPACTMATEYERACLAALRDALHPTTGDPRVRERFMEGRGLCRRHFVAAALAFEEPESLKNLAAVQARAWDALSWDLKEYVRKHDYRFSREPKTPAEETSWLRAVATISGVPSGATAGEA